MSSDCPAFAMLDKIHILPAHRFRPEYDILTVSLIDITLSDEDFWRIQTI